MGLSRIIIAAGGTGGHLVPAQALADQLLEQLDIELLFAGAKLSSCPFFARSRYPFVDIPSGTLSLRHPLRTLKGLWQLLRGWRRAYKLLKQLRPDLVIGFGSFYTVPIMLAAKQLKVPYMLHEGNAIPGRVVRLFAPSARLTGIAIPAAEQWLRGRIETVATPLRSGYRAGCIEMSVARQQLGLDPNAPTLLVFGGSQGAQTLNQLAVLALARAERWQVIHLTGRESVATAMRASYSARGQRCYVAAYHDEMATVWTAADLALMRAGASSLAEQIAMEVPALLVPYPYATDLHQDRNAEWIEELGGGIKLPQAGLSAEQLGDQLLNLNHDRLQQMRTALGAYKQCSGRSLVDYIKEELQ